MGRATPTGAAFQSLFPEALMGRKLYGRSRGFGFAEMGSDQEVFQAMNGKDVARRALTVHEAKAGEDRGGAAVTAVGAKRLWRWSPVRPGQHWGGKGPLADRGPFSF